MRMRHTRTVILDLFFFVSNWIHWRSPECSVEECLLHLIPGQSDGLCNNPLSKVLLMTRTSVHICLKISVPIPQGKSRQIVFKEENKSTLSNAFAIFHSKWNRLLLSCLGYMWKFQFIFHREEFYGKLACSTIIIKTGVTPPPRQLALCEQTLRG